MADEPSKSFKEQFWDPVAGFDAQGPGDIQQDHWPQDTTDLVDAAPRGALLRDTVGGEASSPVFDADGTLLGVTRMVHITEYACFHEQGYYTPGDSGAPVYRTRAGAIGVAICYDRHFPEYMRALAVGGADLVVVPQAGAVDEWPEGLFEGEMRTAALQNGYFVALCNRVGREECLEFAGESFVCAPDGTVVARAAQGRDEILYADIDLAACQASHARRLFLQHRRPELYADWVTAIATKGV